jgi:hypothetical protein
MKWIDPLERFVEVVIALWLLHIVFESVSHPSKLPRNDND